MDPQRQQALWATAVENYQAAVLMAQHGWYNVSVTCSYYAVFTAMWVALGDPPTKGRWEHGGIVKPFAAGQWHTPPHPIESDVIRAARQLYEYRLDAHYRAVRLTPLESAAGVMTARRILRLVAHARSLALGGIIL